MINGYFVKAIFLRAKNKDQYQTENVYLIIVLQNENNKIVSFLIINEIRIKRTRIQYNPKFEYIHYNKIFLF